ncbi:MAG TPA: TIGR02680 family protein [Thermoanaerobaculia bacterium]|nr:TIGR02680 family protein [Thermoanaerobaculia bacterium]
MPIHESPEPGESPGRVLEFLPGAEAPPFPGPNLPGPSRERFQPLRAGIVNVWQYDEQELRFHDGRLILRGENGTGKSKALEVLLPFLFDADLSPHRLDPFGGTSRTMEWNLLQGGRYESRVGYVWLELARRAGEDEEGPREVYWTLGCGLRASQRVRRVDAWYFLTRRRVGQDLLVSTGKTPLLKEQLRQQIGEDGWVFETGREYREKLDAHLFGLGEDRFSTLRHLLLQLRRPHLSERLDPNTLSEILKESLPPLDTDLIGQLSEGFERLDNEQKELARVEAAAAGVTSFLEIYREYGRGVARGRAAEVRQSDSRYHKTAGEVREAEEARDLLDSRLDGLATREQEMDTALAATRGAIRALEQSEAMRSAEAIRAKREQAESLARQAIQDREDTAREARQAAERRRGFESAGREARRLDGEHQEAARRALAAAAEARLEAVGRAALEALPGRAGAAEALVRAAVRRGEESVAELKRLAGERDRTRQREEGAQERRREADARLRAAVERSFAAREGVECQRGELEEALSAWWSGLAELRLDETAFAPLRDRVAQIAAGEEGDLAAAVAEAARPLRDALVRERVALEAETDRIAREKKTAEEERERVAAARELGPEPPRTRESDRTERPGAPLYLLCELAPGLPEEGRAGLEAALEAAGLLDAWVMPDGRVLSGEHDTFLVPASGQEAAEATLADLLVPSPGHGVSRELIEAVLRSVEIGPAGDAAFGVGTDGTFRLGPLSGSWSKPVAEHLGAGAREAARERRLLELAAQIAGLGRALEDVAARGEAVDGRLAALDRETASVPSAGPLGRAALQAEAARADEARRREEHEAAERELAEAREAREAAETRLAARARELDLAPFLEDLEGYRRHLLSFEASFRDLVRSSEAATAAAERLEEARRLTSEAESYHAELARRARESSAAATAADAERAELEATVGAEAQEVLARHRAETRRLQELEDGRRRLADEIQEAREQRARFRERVALRQAELAEREAERTRAVTRLERAAGAGLLPLVLEEAPRPAAWSLTRALELAREIERATPDVDLAPEASNRRANRLHDRFRILSADLGADYQPSLDQDEDLLLARVGYNGREHDIPGLLGALRDEADSRRALLADHERDLLRRHLLGDVGDHLRNRLRQARALVDDMNELLTACRTASGMALKLAWEPIPEAAPEVREAVRLLRQDLALLADGDRRRLEAFFQDRISEARQQWEAVPWREHLLAALDYRGWYRFRILRRTGDGDWAELTRRGHDASSGGEKAVALHLPLFAAAAAHYRSARKTAPRVILLDEAFAGIDQGMRGRCMGLLVDLDLDFLMTSHEEWGCYEELPGVATYQLYRDPALDGVAAVRFVWNGRGLHEEPAISAEAPG